MSAAPHFERALNAQRERFNQQFKLAQATRPTLDAQAFGNSLRDWVGPLVEAVAAIDEEKVEPTTAALYEVALALLLAGQSARSDSSTALDQLWKQVLPLLAASVAVAPGRVSGALSNAALYLQRHGARWPAWLEGLSQAAAELPAADEIDTLLAAGQLLAWRAGIPAFRQGALQRAAHLPTRVLAACLDWPSTDPELLSKILARMSADPWAEPLPAHGPAQLVEVGRVGGFAGLGGNFIGLPNAEHDRGRLRLVDRMGQARVVCADLYGAQLLADTEVAPWQSGAALDAVQVNGNVLRHWPSGSKLTLSGKVRSWAFDGHTVAVCLQSSYWVRLFACRPQLKH